MCPPLWDWSPFMCLPEWWCPPLRSCLCLVSLHLFPFMCLPECGVRFAGLVCALSLFICLPSCVSLSGGSASPVLFVPRLPSFVFVSLSGGVRLAGLVCALSLFICLPEWWYPPRWSCLCLVSLYLSPFIYLPEWWCMSRRACLCLVSLHLSLFIALYVSLWVWCPPRWFCLFLVSLYLSPFMCLPEWWCMPRRSCLCLVSLYLSLFTALYEFPWVVVSASPVLSVPRFPLCVSLSGGYCLAGLVCASSAFICLPSYVSPSGGVRLAVLSVFCLALFISLYLSPFMCRPEWWCPPFRSCLSLYIFLSGGVRFAALVCALSPFIYLPWWGDRSKGPCKEF